MGTNPVSFRSPYVNRPVGVPKDFVDVRNMTQQEFKGECDINRIMKKAVVTGVLPSVGGGRFGDFSDVGDFQSAQNRLLEAEELFESLPSGVRDRFRNDVGSLLEFVSKEENLAEARKLGLVAPEVVPAGPVKVEVVAPVAAPPVVPVVPPSK